MKKKNILQNLYLKEPVNNKRLKKLTNDIIKSSNNLINKYEAIDKLNTDVNNDLIKINKLLVVNNNDIVENYNKLTDDRNKFKDGKEFYESEVQRLKGNKILFEYISYKKKENDKLRKSKEKIKKKSIETLLIEALNDKFITHKKHLMDIMKHNKTNAEIKNNEELLFKTMVNTLRIYYGKFK